VGVQYANGVLNQVYRMHGGAYGCSSSRLRCRGGLQRAHGFETRAPLTGGIEYETV
jgi:hypothetical protein